MNALRRNNTYIVVDAPPGRKITGSKWVYKTKRLADGSLERYKARAVAQGFTQIAGYDYDEVFAPVVRYESLRILLALVALQGWDPPRQFDVKSAFLYGELTEDVYLRPLPGYEEGDKVWKLKKCLYGLKQSAMEWFNTISRSLISKGFQASTFDPCVFVNADSTIYVSVYVDDSAVYAARTADAERILNELKKEFEITDLGIATYMLGLQITYDDEFITISQEGYINRMLKKFGMDQSRPVSTPLDKGARLTKGTPEDQIAEPAYYQSMTGSLMHAVTGTRPDLAHSTSLLSQFNSCPTEPHVTAAKHCMRYVNGTKDWKLRFPRNSKLFLEVYSDADYATCLDTRRSFSGYIVRIGNCTVSWRTRKQDFVATSTTEAEYLALSLACRQLQWIQKALKDFSLSIPCALRTDSTGAMAVATNNRVNERTKHIDVAYHKVREEVLAGKFELVYVPSNENLADIATKTLPKSSHHHLSGLLMNA